MKKYIYLTLVAIMLAFTAIPSYAKNSKPDLTEKQKARISQIELRVQQIKDMDRSQLSTEERKELRQELRAMQKEARALAGGGVYLSVAAIIIIVLVLILIL